VDVIDPVDAEKVLAGHFVQVTAPVPDWYLPPVHGTHADDTASPAAAEKVPAAHPMQLVALVLCWYCPPTHGRQLVAPCAGW
jgi:hypothetical protein